jgi:hypothetical protein
MMTKKWLAVLLILWTSFCTAQDAVLKQGMRISKSIKIKKGLYLVEAPADTSHAVILIEGNNLVIDFSEAELRGGTGKLPDAFYGVAICIRNSKKVTIRNLSARGYKVALLARNVEDLIIENCDFSYNYRQHLNSTQEKEDISDWMSYHHNEKDEWLRYGAAMYLRNCDRAIIRDCKVTGGQNALMMMESDHGKIYNNDFSFNSGIGIGLYRCNANEFCYNRLNFNVRGYSHGVFNRGQDSAGFLVYEQSNFNIFYKNSATHSGDGFFLWAGQTTMDTGGGGCNDNVISGNDFSYAPTNGVEVTFSRVSVTGNLIYECDHGIWGGYSFNSKFCNNQFRDNRIAIAIEHGVHNEISYNVFSKDKEAIRLWSRKQQPSDWGYAKYRDTRSADYIIAMNRFNDHPMGLNLSGTDSLHITANTWAGNRTWKLDSSVTHIDTSDVELIDTVMSLPFIKNPTDPFVGNNKYAGRKNILITEWGPYDFRSPIIWNTNPTDSSGLMKFDILGPAGQWKVRSYSGVGELSAVSGVIPASITARKLTGPRTDIRIELEYIGEEIISPFGAVIKAGRPSAFRFRKFFQPVKWEIDWFSYDSLSDLIKRPEAMYQLNKQPTLKHEISDRLDYAWWGGIRTGEKQYPQFFTLARGQADFPPGDYELSVTWDDAVRVYLDGKLLIDEWQPSKYTFDESPNRKIKIHLAGNHNFKVEHVELNGFATLALKLRRLD